MAIDPRTLSRARDGDPASVEKVLATITEDARRQRRRTVGWVWVTSAVVAVLCLVGFALFVTTGQTGAGGGSPHEVSGGNFSMGIAIGLAAGVAIGWAMGRAKSR